VLPGLATAFDEEAMKRFVRDALFGADGPAYVVERCTPTRPLYIPGDSCMLRYQFAARHSASGEVLEPILTGRVFATRGACEAYLRDKLAPLAERMKGRTEVAAFAAPAAAIEPLDTVVYVWPIDGELPTLVDATDPRRMLEVLREVGVGDAALTEECRIELVSYRRRQRCVLRYTVGADEAPSLVVYGKVTGVGNATLADPAIDELREHVRDRAPHLRLPHLLAWRPELQLALLEALPGEAAVRTAVRKRLRARPEPGPLSLEDMVAMSAEVAAALHTSGRRLGPVRAFEDELAGLEREVDAARPFVAEFAERADLWLERIDGLGRQIEGFELGLCHGDFNHGQLLFDGNGASLLDLDTLCWAEPVLDLGKFVAHVRAETEKLRRRAAVSSRLGDDLAEQFLDAYLGVAGASAEDGPRLRARAAVYEAMALLRLAVRSQHDFEETRLEIATGLLEDRLAAISRRK
jgi:aminoglycoside phosphotransferase (APT) family kinase protein